MLDLILAVLVTGDDVQKTVTVLAVCFVCCVIVLCGCAASGPMALIRAPGNVVDVAARLPSSPLGDYQAFGSIYQAIKYFSLDIAEFVDKGPRINAVQSV